MTATGQTLTRSKRVRKNQTARDQISAPQGVQFDPSGLRPESIIGIGQLDPCG